MPFSRFSLDDFITYFMKTPTPPSFSDEVQNELSKM